MILVHSWISTSHEDIKAGRRENEQRDVFNLSSFMLMRTRRTLYCGKEVDHRTNKDGEMG